MFSNMVHVLLVNNPPSNRTKRVTRFDVDVYQIIQHIDKAIKLYTATKNMILAFVSYFIIIMIDCV